MIMYETAFCLGLNWTEAAYINNHTRSNVLQVSHNSLQRINIKYVKCNYEIDWVQRLQARNKLHIVSSQDISNFMIHSIGVLDHVLKGYRMVFASICEHARSAFIFASGSSDQFSLGSSEHFVKFPAIWNLSLLKRCFVPSNLAHTFKTGQQAQS